MKKSIFIYACAFILSTPLMAQVETTKDATQHKQMHDGSWKKELNLTDDQKQKMKALHESAKKDIMPLRKQLEEKKANLQKLSSAENPDESTISAEIDEIAKLQAQIQKIRVHTRLEVRKLLNDEQRAIFDAHKPGPGKQCQKPCKGGPKK